MAVVELKDSAIIAMEEATLSLNVTVVIMGMQGMHLMEQPLVRVAVVVPESNRTVTLA